MGSKRSNSNSFSNEWYKYGNSGRNVGYGGLGGKRNFRGPIGNAENPAGAWSMFQMNLSITF